MMTKKLAKTRFTKMANKMGLKGAKPGDLLAYRNREANEGLHAKMTGKEKAHEKGESKAEEKAEHKVSKKLKDSMKMAV